MVSESQPSDDEIKQAKSPTCASAQDAASLNRDRPADWIIPRVKQII